MSRCPICFREIQTTDLMYEVWFYRDDIGEMISPDHEWIINTPLRNLFDKKSKANCIHYMEDRQLNRLYGKSGLKNKRYLMLSRKAWVHAGRNVKHGDYAVFTHFMEKIQNYQNEVGADGESEDFEDDFGQAFFQEDSVNGEETFSFENSHDFEETASGTGMDAQYDVLHSYYNISGKMDGENRGYRVYVNDILAFELIPCCPHCHARLPKGWISADHYVPIGFFSPKYGGKTTIMESIVANEFEIFNSMQGIWANPAQDAVFAPYYKSILERANQLIKEKKYPEGSQPFYRLPIFFILELEGKKVLVGLFDIAGETLENLDPLDPMADFLMHMSGIVCLVDPNSMSVHLKPDIEYVGDTPAKENASERGNSERRVILKMIAQQAQEQKNCRKEISVRELLAEESKSDYEEAASMMKKYNGADHQLTVQTFRDFCSFVNQKAMDGEKPLKNIHLAMTIMKSDELKDTPEIQSMDEGKQIVLFQEADNLEEYIGREIREIRDTVVPGLFDEYFFKGNEKKVFTEPFKSVSWHCISAVGCSRTIKVYKEGSSGADIYYDGEYRPIRVVEPVLECVFREMGIFG